MTRGNVRRLHGASFVAPDEGFSAGESPPPPSARVGRDPSTPRKAWMSDVEGALRFLAGVVVVVSVSVGVAWSAHRYAVTSPRFAVRKIEVQGGHRFGPDEVRAEAGIAPSHNLFALDTKLVERKLLENPWIAAASVSRRLPSTLKVELRERETRAVTVIGGQAYLVSNQGEPFKRVVAGDPTDLPVITGLDPEELARDRRRELDRLGLALEVLRQYDRIGLSRSYVAQEIHLGEGGTVSLTVGKQGLTIFLGKGPFRQRLLMAERVLEETRKAGKLPGIVFADNVAHPERVIVRMR
jgi:cell division protein FtsQ